MVTRCPIQLQLINNKAEIESNVSYALFKSMTLPFYLDGSSPHIEYVEFPIARPGRVYTDFSEVGGEIQKITDETTSGKKVGKLRRSASDCFKIFLSGDH